MSSRGLGRVWRGEDGLIEKCGGQRRRLELHRELSQRVPAVGVLWILRLDGLQNLERAGAIARGDKRARQIVACEIDPHTRLERILQVWNGFRRSSGVDQRLPIGIVDLGLIGTDLK